jgi:hypothetical protein
VSFAILRNFQPKPPPTDDPFAPPAPQNSVGTQAALLFFLLVIFVGIFYWLDVGSVFSSSPATTSSGGASLSQEYEREFIKTIREDVTVGVPNF